MLNFFAVKFLSYGLQFSRMLNANYLLTFSEFKKVFSSRASFFFFCVPETISFSRALGCGLSRPWLGPYTSILVYLVSFCLPCSSLCFVIISLNEMTLAFTLPPERHLRSLLISENLQYSIFLLPPSLDVPYV